MTTTEQRKSDQIGTMKVQPTPTLPMRRMRDAFTQDDTKVLGRILGQTTSAQIYLSIQFSGVPSEARVGNSRQSKSSVIPACSIEVGHRQTRSPRQVNIFFVRGTSQEFSTQPCGALETQKSNFPSFVCQIHYSRNASYNFGLQVSCLLREEAPETGLWVRHSRNMDI